MRYYAKIEDTHLSNLLITSRIITDNQLVVLSGSIWQYCQDTGRSTGAYIVFDQCGPIDNCTHNPGLVSQSSADI